MPFYPELHKHPSFNAPKSIDLEGLVDIHSSQDGERVERVLFYRFLDNSVVHVCVNFLLDDGFILPDYYIRNLVFRTLVEYRDLD